MGGLPTWSTSLCAAAGYGAHLPALPLVSSVTRVPCEVCSRAWPLSAAVLPHRFMIIPDMLKNAPMFKRIDPKHKVTAHVQCPFSLIQNIVTSDFRSGWSVHRSLQAFCTQTKAAPMGVGGRGRAVAARAKAKAGGK